MRNKSILDVKNWPLVYDIRRFVSRVLHVLKWVKTLWFDDDWDSHYIYKILKFKLINTRAYILKKNRFIGVEFVCRDIQWCIDLIDKVNSDYYGMEWLDYFESDHEFVPIEGTDLYSWESIEVWEKYKEYLDKYPNDLRKFLKQTEFEGSESVLAMKLASFRQDKARKLLFTILEQKIEQWWD